MIVDTTARQDFSRRFRLFIWLLRVELLAAIVTLVLFLRHPNMRSFAYFVLTLVPGIVTLLNPPRRKP